MLVPYTTRLDAEQLRRLHAMSEATGAPVSELIRRMLDAEIPRWESRVRPPTPEGEAH